MKIGILGSGDVAKDLGAGLARHGHAVTLGTRDASKLAAWQAGNPGTSVGSFAEAAAAGELVVLAVKGHAAEAVLEAAGVANLAGKVVIDATNPIEEVAPDNGVLRYFTGPNESHMERLQAAYPQLHLVKAFNSVGSASMVDPGFAGGPPTMFICGNNPDAKRVVTRLLEEIGWEAVDMGGVQAARAIEPLAMLWCIPGFLRGEWRHAFKLLR